MFIVLVTSGKHDSVDYAKVRLFEEYAQAEDYIKRTCTGRQKYWNHAEILRDGETVELMQPEE